MKKTVLSIFAFLFYSVCFSQKGATENYYQSIGKQDISELILASNSNYGFLGNDYWRFYIHFNSAKKNPKNPYEYTVTGKTRFKDNINSFSGAITVLTAEIIENTDFTSEDEPGYPKGITHNGTLKASVVLNEDKNQSGSGEIRGMLYNEFILVKGKVEDAGPTYYGDLADASYHFDGTWTSYKTGNSKRCLWHSGNIYKIDNQNLFHNGDDGDLYINQKYLKNGWESFQLYHHPVYTGSSEPDPVTIEAEKKEKEKWWE